MSRPKPKSINVELAPANEVRVTAYIEARRLDPERPEHPLTLTDVVNEALERFLSTVQLDSAPTPERPSPNKQKKRNTQKG